MKIFGERLRELRTEKKLSAKKLGQELGISDASIIRWENDDVDPSISQLKKIAVHFNVTADYLIGLEN